MSNQRGEMPEPRAQEQAGESKRELPKRILALLEFVADRHPPEGLAPYEDEHGEPMQDDADAALAWISTSTAALQAKDAEIARLKAVLMNARQALEDANEAGSGGPIQDTIWMPVSISSAETLFDYLDAAMKGEAA